MIDTDRLNWLERMVLRGDGSVMLTAWFSKVGDVPDGFDIGIRPEAGMQEFPSLRDAIDAHMTADDL